MAFLDDRVWCHPKWKALTPSAFRLGIHAICYAHGFSTRGVLDSTAIRTLNASRASVDELVKVGLWERDGNAFLIHDWGDYNDDERLERRRKLTRERVRRFRDRQTSGNGSNADEALPKRDTGRVTSRARATESESDVDPLTPAERGNVTLNPRAAGTNPRALADRERVDRHAALIAAAVKAADDWGPASTEILHERLDDLERVHRAIFTDQERSRIVDHAVARWSP